MNQDDAVVNMFALAHPGRLSVFKIIAASQEKGMAAGLIAKAVGIPANTASTHLSILTGAGLLSAYRDGRSIIYRANFEHFTHLMRFLVADCALSNEAVLHGLDTLQTDLAPQSIDQ
jgi:ArsR family transcriptional regulator, arsenate/arsenite/antimonite-responsive transcriptional repressor